jgi:hypothetical protein
MHISRIFKPLTRWIYASLMLAGGLAPSSAHAAVPCRGVWSGTLGGIPITLEITETYGRYYYRENFSDLVLVPTNSLATEWQESDSKGKQTGRAYLNCEPGKLDGIWMSADESKTLSINAVSSASYDARRTAKLPLKVRKTQTLDSRSIDTVFVNGIPSLNALRLRGDGPGIQRANGLLQKDLASHVSSHLSCVAGGLAAGRLEDPWGDELDQQAVFWKGDVLSVQTSYGGYCGGAHPSHGQSYQTYDTSAGKAIPIANWLDTAYRKKVDLQSPLGKMIKSKLLGGNKSTGDMTTDERECAEEALTNSAHITAIEKQGIGFGFPFPYAMSPCQADHVIPWSRMRPFLSEEGKRLLNEIERN